MSVIELTLMLKIISVILAVVLFLSSVLGLLFIFGYMGDSAARVRREHGLTLPASARGFVCRGDAWMHLFSDSGAASAFEMTARDLPGFLSQLKILGTNDCTRGTIFPLNAQYQIHRPWTAGVSMKTYRCTSSTGNSLTVQIWPIDGDNVGVLLYTDWN